jgi:hypothetical protein
LYTKYRYGSGSGPSLILDSVLSTVPGLKYGKKEAMFPSIFFQASTYIELKPKKTVPDPDKNLGPAPHLATD